MISIKPDLKIADESRLCPTLDGIYSDFDARVAYALVRQNKPLTVLDCAPREGKTTSVILAALLMNGDKVTYYIYEKDAHFLKEIRKFLSQYTETITFIYNENILESELPDSIDLAFVDANHDYILAEWMRDHVYSRAKLIHVHDIYYNSNGNCWRDARLIGCGQSHPDIIDVGTLRRLYPTIFDKYYDGVCPVLKFEGDVVADYIIDNELEFLSTLQFSRGIDGSNTEFPNCSVWIKNKQID